MKIQTQWRSFIAGVIINSFFWYLCVFLFNRPFITELDFYVPMIISVALSIPWYMLGLTASLFFTLMVEGEEEEEKKEKIEKKKNKDKFSSEDYMAMIFSVCFLCGIGFDMRNDRVVGLTAFVSEAFLVLGTLTLIIFIPAIVVNEIRKFRRRRKKKKRAEEKQ